MGLSISAEPTELAIKDVEEAEKHPTLAPKNHRYNFLKVNEVSIVTEPAILSQEEADKGVGFPIVKFVDEDEATAVAAEPAVVSKEVRLITEAKKFLSYYLEEEHVATLSVVKLSEDFIVFTAPYEKVLDNDSLFLKLLYKEDEAGIVTFARPKKFNLTFEENNISSEKIYEIVKELPMSQITGVEVGGKIVKITPIPGIEFESEDGELIFRCDENGVLKTGESYSIDDDGVVRKTEDIVPSNVGYATSELEDANKFYLSMEQVQELMAASGKSFNFSVGEDGLLKIDQVADIDPALMVPGISDSNAAEKAGHKDDEDKDKKKPMKAGHEDEEEEDGKKKPKKAAHYEDEDEDKKKPKKMGHEDDEDEEDKKKPKKSTEADLDEVSLRLKQLEDELAKAKQKLAGSSTTDPEVGENAVKVMGRENFPVEKEHAPVDGNYQRGIFTRHIDKRLLDRRSRLQADIISG